MIVMGNTSTEDRRIAQLSERVQRLKKHHRLWTKVWSFVHYASLYGAAVLSAAAALLIKIAPEEKDLSAIFAGVAALSVTITILGSPIPLTNYLAIITVKPEGDRSRVI